MRGEPWGFHNKGVRVVGKGRVGRRHLFQAWQTGGRGGMEVPLTDMGGVADP